MLAAIHLDWGTIADSVTAAVLVLVASRLYRASAKGVEGSVENGGEEPNGRTVHVGASHRVSAFDIAQRDVAGIAQESSDAVSARSVLPLAAPVVMVHVDELPLLKRLVAHAAGVLLDPQKQVEQLLGQPIAVRRWRWPGVS